MKSLKKPNRPVILFLFLISFLFRLYGIKAVGETWDEIAVVRNGAIYLKYISKLDISSKSWQLNKEHPPVAKYLYGATQILPQISEKIADFDGEYPMGRKFTLARILSSVFGSIATVFVFLLAKALYDDDMISIFAALIFSFLPHVLAHTKIAALESPLLLFTLISTYFYLKNEFALSGLFLGFSLATKFNALFFIFFFVLLSILFYFSGKRKQALKGLILVPFIAVILLFIIWPWLWSNPIGHFSESLKVSQDVADRQYFLGVDTKVPSAYYYFIYFGATTPILLLFLFFTFLLKILIKRECADFIILLYFLTPFMATFFSLKQDGIRYIFPMFPALAIGGSVGLFFIIKHLKRVLKTVSAAFLSWALVFFVFISVLFASLSVHPYYLDYYNALVGGSKNVYEKRMFEIGWWGEGIRDGLLYVNETAFKNATVSFSFAPEHVAPILRKDLVRLDDSDTADFVVTNPFAEWYDGVWVDPKNYDAIHIVKSANAPITKVFKKKALKL